MSFDTNKMAIKLLRCRGNLELSLEEVSEMTGILKDRLQAIESGRIEPYGDEVLILADIYQEDFKFFISNEKLSASEKVEELYRAKGDKFTKEDKRMIQTFINLCDNEQFVWDSLQVNKNKYSLPYINQDFIKKEDGILAAKALRKHLGYNGLEGYNNLYSEFRKLGIHIFRMRLQNSTLSGLFIKHPEAGLCILINYDENIYRQNFTLAHEIGHALMDAMDFNVSLSDDKTDFREYRANAFASSFLMPPEIIEQISESSLTNDFIYKQADKFRVNVPAFLIALKNANILDNNKYHYWKKQQIRIPRTKQYDYEFKDLTGKLKDSYSIVMEKGLTPSYIRFCHQAYQENIISEERLSEMLLIDIYELAYLLELFNLKL